MLASVWSKAARPKSLPHFAGATAASTTTTCTGTGPCQAFRPSTHQRRKSSSKSSNAQKDELRPLSTAPSTPVGKDAIAESPGPAKRRSTTKVSRPRSKPAVEEAGASKKNSDLAQLPAVPSTQHLHPHDIHVASFFSIHRPISVTSAVPAESSSNDFSQIFSANPRPRMTDVITTLSNVVNTLEKSSSQDPAKQPSLHEQRRQLSSTEADLQNVISKALKSLNITPSANTTIHVVEVQTQEPDASSQDVPTGFKHFVPPPPPVPLLEHDNSTIQVQRHSRPPRARTLGSRLLALRQQSAPYPPNARATITHPLPPPPSKPHFFNPSTPSPIEAILSTYLPSNSKQPFLRRMWLRQLFWEAQNSLRGILAASNDGNGNVEVLKGEEGGVATGMVMRSGSDLAHEVWRAISTKRQRKLKMKKHKYKKLMRRTRNLRRKLDKL